MNHKRKKKKYIELNQALYLAQANGRESQYSWILNYKTGDELINVKSIYKCRCTNCR